MSLAIKKQILKEVRNSGLAGALDDDALDCITDFLKQQGNAEQLQPLLKSCQRDRPTSGTVTRSVVEAAISQLLGRGQGLELLEVINAFDVPKISYDAVGRKMFADSAPRSLFADAPAKHSLYLDRLQLISQHMRRHRAFQQNHQVLAQSAPGNYSAQLTDLQSLRGMVGEQRFVMGCVSRGEDGAKLLLEDATGSVPLDISQAQWASGFFTDNCIVIAQGMLSHDGVFHAQILSLPPVERRDDLAEASKRLNFFGGKNLSSDERAALASPDLHTSHEEDRIVVCANVWLDQQTTLDRLATLFAGFQSVVFVPTVFVLMGNFHSKAPAVAGSMSASQRAGCGNAGSAVDYQSLRDGFAALAKLIDQFPRIKDNSQFIFVPGPGDPTPSDVIPQPALPPYFTAEVMRVLPNAVFASNPCRIRYLNKEIVIFRYDILKRLRRRCLLPLLGGEPTTVEAMWQHLTLTLLQQSHLCPLPLLHQPIYWQYDHALHLYPLPHAVILADASPQATHTHEGCTVFTPGSFADGFFAAYVPFKPQEQGGPAVEMSELPTAGIQQYDIDDEDDTLPSQDTAARDVNGHDGHEGLGARRNQSKVASQLAGRHKQGTGPINRRQALLADFKKPQRLPKTADNDMAVDRHDEEHLQQVNGTELQDQDDVVHVGEQDNNDHLDQNDNDDEEYEEADGDDGDDNGNDDEEDGDMQQDGDPNLHEEENGSDHEEDIGIDVMQNEDNDDDGVREDIDQDPIESDADDNGQMEVEADFQQADGREEAEPGDVLLGVGYQEEEVDVDSIVDKDSDADDSVSDDGDDGDNDLQGEL